MDKQARSAFIGIMAAFLCIAAIGGIGYGIYYESHADERRKAQFDQSMRDLECSNERLLLLKQGKDFGFGHPCKN